VTTRGGRDRRTRKRLLDAATRLFADRGFRYVTVRAICRAARANVAAVNYHFDDKMGLYREVLEDAASVVTKMTAEAIEAGEGLPADERFRAYVRINCQYIFRAGPKNRLQQLMHRELQEPTAMLDAIIDRVWKPRLEYLGGIVGELLGLPPDDARVGRVLLSVHAQIVMFKPSPVQRRMGRNVEQIFDPAEVANHIIAFSLAGFGAYRAAPAAPAAAGRL
jgi:AcrR family transcriptional regulator